MRKVIGIGETIYDVVFKNNQPFMALPGGSTFNCVVSLGRLNVPALFVSEAGNDKIGNIIKDFMKENNLSIDYIDFFNEGSTPVALAFLDENQDVEYAFCRNFPERRLPIDLPPINENDIVVLGSYFAVNLLLREKILELLENARKRNAVVYYDINFRKAHAYERMKLMSSFLENFEYSTIIRCSDEDLQSLYPGESIDKIYTDRISFYCKNFIVTQGADHVILKTGRFEKSYEVASLDPVSTIGAGDNFNAGIIYGMMKYAIAADDLSRLEEKDWDKLIALALKFSAEVCMTPDNYISKEFAATLQC